MESVRKKLTKLIALCLVLMMIMSTLITNISYAAEVRVVTDEAEKEKLLGISSQRAREKSILGLANEFSLFTNGNVTTYGSDIEGRLAANGNVDFTGTGNYNWKYQVGCGYNNYGPNTTGAAEVIANGSVKNLAVNNGATTSGSTYDAAKTVVSQGLNDTDPTSEVKGWGYADNEVDKFVKSDVIDFESEFNWLKSQSQMLANIQTNLGTVEKKTVKYFVPALYDNWKTMCEVAKGNVYYYYDKYTFVDYNSGGIWKRRSDYTSNDPISYERLSSEVIVFTGTNSDFNVFNISASDFNSLFGTGSSEDSDLFMYGKDLIFNVPQDSSIIINVKGNNSVRFVGSYKNDSISINDYRSYGDASGQNRILSYPKESVYKRTLVPYSEKDIAKDESLKDKFGMYLYDENTGDFVKDSDGKYVLFIDIANDKENEKAKNMLYNVPDATRITLKDNFLGSILAPNADATNENSGINGCCGHLSGNLICKSYTGTMEFGFLPTTAQINDVKYTVNVAKLDKDTKERVSGAELQLYTLNSNKIENITDTTNPTLVETWTSSEEDKVFNLAPGGYYIVEKTAPENFEKESAKTYFTVEENGDINKNFNTKKEFINYNNVKLYDNIRINEFEGKTSQYIFPMIESVNPNYKYRVPKITFTLTTDNESLKGKEYTLQMDTRYNAFRNESLFNGSSNFTTKIIDNRKVKEGSEIAFSIPVYGWANWIDVRLYNESGSEVSSNFSFTNVKANIPKIETKTFSASEDNSSIYDKYTISITNKKIPEKEPEKEPEKDPEKEPEKKPEQDPEKKPEQEPEKKPEQDPGKTPEQTPEKTPEKQPEQTPNQEQPKEEQKQEPATSAPNAQAPAVQETKNEPTIIKEITKLVPKTGDKILLCVAILGVSCVVFIATGKKKIKNQKKDKK